MCNIKYYNSYYIKLLRNIGLALCFGRGGGEGVLQHSTNQACMVEWSDGSHSWVKSTCRPAGSLPKGTWRTLRPWKTKFSGLIKLMKDWTLSPECPASCLEETRHCSSSCQYHPTVKQNHAVGIFFSSRNWETGLYSASISLVFAPKNRYVHTRKKNVQAQCAITDYKLP